MPEETVLRPLSGRVIAAVLVVFASAIVIAGLVQLGIPRMLPHLAIPVLIGYLGWFLFWAPCVRVSPGEVVIDNPSRLVRLQWPQITFIDTKWALEIHTEHGRYTAWAAPAPGRHTVMRQTRGDLKHVPRDAYELGTIRPGDIPTSDSGAAASVVRRTWESLREAGHLDNARPESPLPDTRIHWVRLAVLLALVVLVVVSATL